MAERKLHMILAGDVIESVGTRSYLREMMRHFERIGIKVHCHCFQFRLYADLPGGECRINDFDAQVYLAPGGWLFRLLPRAIYRLLERLVLWRFLHRALGQIGARDAMIGSGCLGVMYMGARRPSANAWWLKLGLIEEQARHGLRYRVRKQIESMHARRFPNRIVVSEAMGAFIAGEYGAPRGEQLILPCLVDMDDFPSASRERLRLRLELQDRFVVTYVGTAAPWQCATETVAMFRLLRARIPHALLWVFTPDQESFGALLGDLPKDCWRIEFRPHHELALALPAADVGCLVRRRDIVNRVASPLKFPEYLACGLPVLIGPEVGSYTRLVEDKRLGVVIDPDRPETWQQVADDLTTMAQDETIHARCRREAELLSWQSYESQLMQVVDHA